MSLVPGFEIGWANGWTVALGFLLLPQLVQSLIYRDALSKWTNEVPYGKGEKRAGKIWPLLLLVIAVYSVFLPLRLGTMWFYTGLGICILAAIGNVMIPVANARTAPDSPFTKGPYCFSRHPHYLNQFLILLGMGVACASWLLFLATSVFIALIRLVAIPEERFCLEKYGELYAKYSRRTPRWIGIPRRRES